MKIKLGTADGQALRVKYPNSEFLEEQYDAFINGVNKKGGIIYHHMGLLYKIMDERQSEYEGSYEEDKESFNQQFQDFYDEIDEQLLMMFSEMETQYDYKKSGGLIPAELSEDE